jgi:hypothetical protein
LSDLLQLFVGIQNYILDFFNLVIHQCGQLIDLSFSAIAQVFEHRAGAITSNKAKSG